MRNRANLPANLTGVTGLGPLRSRVPYRFVREAGIARLHRRFAAALDRAPAGSIAWFWPGVPQDLVKRAKKRGVITVREMINSPLAHAKPILDAAYRAAGLAPSHTITDALVAEENAELALHDYVFSSNDQVDAALAALGIAPHRLLKSTFGWVADRFGDGERMANQDAGFRVAFVGLMNVRKGIPVLLEAWRKSGIDGQLLLAGAIEPCLAATVESVCATGRVQHLGHVTDVAALYRSCDAFVFPTHEEGGPQVTYEAAACGVPVVTTEMGAARLVKDGKTGLIVPAGSVDALAAALVRLASDPGLRESLRMAALAQVGQFEYHEVGRQRAGLLRAL